MIFEKTIGEKAVVFPAGLLVGRGYDRFFEESEKGGKKGIGIFDGKLLPVILDLGVCLCYFVPDPGRISLCMDG